jgi:hypothetical protein
MFSKLSVNLLLTSAFALAGTAANALTLNGSSGSWSNPIGGSFIEYQTIGEENQIRWGDPVIPGAKSGLGFTGVDGTDIELENVFQIGMLRHFNNVIYGNTAASAVNLALSLDFAEFGLKTFDFNLEIDETPNTEGTCIYPSITACSDKISFPITFSPESFEIDGVSYTLSLVGFSYGSDQSLLSDFISEEYTTSEALLFGKITAVENLTAISTQPETKVPEPQTIGGFLALGLILTNRFLKRDSLK